MTEPIKPGVKSTEFYVTVGVQIVGVILALGVVTPEQADTLTKAITQGAGVIAMLISAFSYAKSRAAVKSAKPEGEK
jgi:uncharacterized NAD-dependent epimerase/dehydratase family protein